MHAPSRYDYFQTLPFTSLDDPPRLQSLNYGFLSHSAKVWARIGSAELNKANLNKLQLEIASRPTRLTGLSSREVKVSFLANRSTGSKVRADFKRGASTVRILAHLRFMYQSTRSDDQVLLFI